MNKQVKMIYTILGLTFLFAISPTLANNTCDGFDMFGMSCCIEKGISASADLQMNTGILYSYQSGTIYQSTASGDIKMDSGSQNFWYFQILFERRGFTTINYLEDIYLNGAKYTVTLGQKCGHPEVRINGKQYRNDRGIFDIKSDNQYLRLYYYENNILSAIRCSQTTSIPASTAPNTGNLTTNSGNLESRIQNLESSPISQQTSSNLDPRHTTLDPIILNNIKTYQQLNSSTLYDLVKQWGMDWKTDRKDLAQQAGIDPATYKGTKTQNLIIRNYLMNKISVNIQATNTPDVTLSAARFQEVQSTTLWRIVGLRSYTWQKDRMGIAKEYGYEPQIYFGTRAQNLKIRAWLLDKIHIQE